MECVQLSTGTHTHIMHTRSGEMRKRSGELFISLSGFFCFCFCFSGRQCFLFHAYVASGREVGRSFSFRVGGPEVGDFSSFSLSLSLF